MYKGIIWPFFKTLFDHYEIVVMSDDIAVSIF